MPKLTIYSKPNCHLCDVMKTELNKFKVSYDFELEEINIETDKAVFESFKEKIPVLAIDGKIFAKYKLDGLKLIKKLNSF